MQFAKLTLQWAGSFLQTKLQKTPRDESLPYLIKSSSLPPEFSCLDMVLLASKIHRHCNHPGEHSLIEYLVPKFQNKLRREGKASAMCCELL